MVKTWHDKFKLEARNAIDDHQNYVSASDDERMRSCSAYSSTGCCASNSNTGDTSCPDLVSQPPGAIFVVEMLNLNEQKLHNQYHHHFVMLKSNLNG